MAFIGILGLAIFFFAGNPGVLPEKVDAPLQAVVQEGKSKVAEAEVWLEANTDPVDYASMND